MSKGPSDGPARGKISLGRADASSYRWIIAAANFLIMTALWLPWAGYGVFLGPIAKELHWQRGAADAAFSIVLIMGAPLGLIVGKIIDRYGPRTLMVFEVICAGAAFLLASAMRELWQLHLSLGVLMGLAFAGAYIVPTATTARWFDRNRGLALSLVMSAIGLAYIIGPPLTVRLMETVGWRNAFLIYGAGIILLGIPPALFLRNPAPADVKSGQPGKAAAALRKPEHSAPPINIRAALLTSTVWMLSAVWLTQSFAQMMFVLHFVPMEVNRGLAFGAAAGAMSFYGIGVLFGRALSGPLADRMGALKVVLGTSVTAALALLMALSAHDFFLLGAASFLFGLSLSGADTAYARALPDIVGAGALGTLMSIFNIGWRVGGAAGPVLAGFLFDYTRLYALPFGIAVAGLLAGGGLFFLVSRPEMQLERVLARRNARL